MVNNYKKYGGQKHAGDYFHDAKEHIGGLKDAGVGFTASAVKGAYSLGALGLQTWGAFNIFKWGAGEIIGAKAAVGLTPAAATPAVVKAATDAAFTVLVANPSAALVGTLGVMIAVDPHNAIGVVKNGGYALANAAKVGYHGILVGAKVAACIGALVKENVRPDEPEGTEVEMKDMATANTVKEDLATIKCDDFEVVLTPAQAVKALVAELEGESVKGFTHITDLPNEYENSLEMDQFQPLIGDTAAAA